VGADRTPLQPDCNNPCILISGISASTFSRPFSHHGFGLLFGFLFQILFPLFPWEKVITFWEKVITSQGKSHHLHREEFITQNGKNHQGIIHTVTVILGWRTT
jgi:hypothetical protein